MFGKLLSYKQTDQKVVIQFEKREGSVEFIQENMLRIFSALEKKEQISYAVLPVLRENNQLFVEQQKQKLIIKNGTLWIEIFDNFKVDIYNKNYELICKDYRDKRISPVIPEDVKQAALEGHTVIGKGESHKIQVIKEMAGSEVFYGLGDKTGFLNKRGYEYVMWNSDIPDPHVDSFCALYKSIPFFITLREKHVYGMFFDNPYRSFFDMGKENNQYYFFGANQGNLDYYFMYGTTIASILKYYTQLTGTHPMPAMWTLGYHQSRWSYESAKEVRKIAKNLRSLDLPCDCIHLDIDYMEGCRVFTHNSVNFPKFSEMIQDLKEDGLKIVTIIDPGVKQETGYSIYEEGLQWNFFIKDAKGADYTNWVWPGTVVFPDFSNASVRAWWGKKHEYLQKLGVSGVWNDMNEPASFHGELPDDILFYDEGHHSDHRRIHNVYGHLMSKATYEGWKQSTNMRPFVITRACYAGSQRYATAWTGDNHSIWAHLQMAIPQLCNLGLSGMPFVGTDVGGFGSDCTAELLSRWVQVGCFSPLFRNHSCKGSRNQEPWAFDQETLDINRKYIKLRYRLLPYFYDLFWEHQKSGLPIMRPLVLEYPADKNTYEINDQFMVGSSLLVAPVVNQGQRIRLVYLPKGTWIDYWTKEVHQGNQYLAREAPLDLCPIYVKAGTILPNYPNQSYVGEKEITQLHLELYPGEGQYYHYQDNGLDFAYETGEYNEYFFQISKTGELNIELLHHGYKESYSSFLIQWQGREKQIPFRLPKQTVILADSL